MNANSLIRSSLVVLALLASTFVRADGMNFDWGINPNKRTQDNLKDVIWMIGDIRPGDYEKFRQFMLNNLDNYISSRRVVFVSSNGGNILESLKIAALLREMYANVYVDGIGKCASSCFLLYVGAVERRADHEKLGIHRPYFDPSYFAGLSPDEAQKRQIELTRRVNDFLENNSVPREIIDRMNAYSSNDIHWLTAAEIDTIGSYAPWYEQFLIAKCQYRGMNYWTDLAIRQKSTQAFMAEIDRVEKCENEFVQAELKKNLRTFLQSTDPLKERDLLKTTTTPPKLRN